MTKKRLFLALAFLLTLYVAGFGMFLAMLPSPFVRTPDVDGVAVFTGGSGRVEATLDVLRQGFGGPVFVSGVHPDVSLAELVGGKNLAGDEKARLTLDAASATTRQNVENTRAWAAERNLRRIGIITSTYHVLRVRVLMAWKAPGLHMVPMPVQPADPSLRALWREYNKLLMVFFLP